jgi:hypothetical protein
MLIMKAFRKEMEMESVNRGEQGNAGKSDVQC